ncbi:hypothetical protein [Pseudooceanicola sp. MF1-13]|uniref:hypothetical protein n=1 Tax=Pseudooceanicola sp. MF1-13 TaxID=3379095 RepID=UPI003891BDA4
MAEATNSLSGLRLWLAAESDPERRSNVRMMMGRRMKKLGMFGAARDMFDAALQETPNDPAIQRSLGLELFRAGRIREGLDMYDSGRWRMESFDKYRRDYPFPTWRGEPLQGRRLLLWAEQGIGDQIMQLRVLPQLLATGAEITLEADPRIKALLGPMTQRIKFVPQLVQLNQSISKAKYDFQTSMLSAWAYQRAPLDCGDCLTADASLVKQYRAAWKRLGDGINVGLSWRSSAKANGEERTLRLEDLRPLTLGPKARFHNLQYGEVDVEASSRAFGSALLTDPASDPLKDLTRQAAQIAALDLVITIDNATAHLAGALGKPVWIILPKGSDFRWGSLVKPMPLYPGQKLFRSGNIDDWSTCLWALFEAFNKFKPA